MTHPQFRDRHIGPSAADVAAMCEVIGWSSPDALLSAAIPGDLRTGRPLDLPGELTESEAVAELRAVAGMNSPRFSMIGLGYVNTLTPAVIRRSVLMSPAWYTAYTPYQPEISQGRLEGLLTFQTMVADLTGLPIANASLLDEPTACAEAMALAHRASRSSSRTFVVHHDLHPQTIAVMRTRAEPVGVEIVVADLADGLPEVDCFGVLVSYPGSSGVVADWSGLAAEAHERGALVAVTTDLLALTVLRDVGQWADIAVGSAQRFGVPMGFGGPHAAFMAVHAGLERQLPGRMVGVSVDADGHRGLRLALQTREQHIRRDRATSNICTSQVLLALMAAFYAQYHGAEGLTAIAQTVHGRACEIADGLAAAGVRLEHEHFFDTVVGVGVDADAVLAAARAAGINLRRIDGRRVGITCDEATTTEHVAAVLAAFGARPVAPGGPRLPAALGRTTAFLTQERFQAYRSETAMMRYLRAMADRDLALDRTMIPLGSCTMKLNAATEMESVTWPEFANLHPFAPADESQGTRRIIADLESWLAEITGYDRVSLQPNAGSQGEFAGLLAIRGYHRARGEDQRDVVLVPSSAHGTNAASAVMAGFRVVVVACTDTGDVDVDDVEAKLAEHPGRVAAIMVTYPSTHGVFEAGLQRICDAVHEAGGQVYVDGANMNALVGMVRLGEVGADVSHLNLHKTFCIPHGGGGPGVGPIGVKSHLADFLPGHPLVPEAGPVGRGPVSGAPYGSPGVLTIPWAYLRLMGPEGLRSATEAAIVSANYVAARLGEHYRLLYTGSEGLVAHECLIDLRGIQRDAGVTVEDVAKRLIDYGFHAPTMSFPVAGTLMVEPTESESVAELDRFCEAMIAIRAEIAAVERGEVPVADSVLRGAPHTAQCLVRDWEYAYSRHEAVYPAGVPEDKYWPPTRRIDNAYGDRHLHCTCEPVEAYEH